MAQTGHGQQQQPGCDSIADIGAASSSSLRKGKELTTPDRLTDQKFLSLKSVSASAAASSSAFAAEQFARATSRTDGHGGLDRNGSTDDNEEESRVEAASQGCTTFMGIVGLQSFCCAAGHIINGVIRSFRGPTNAISPLPVHVMTNKFLLQLMSAN
ncbi:hypothetical protein R1flu_006401 [Riccia fluitans]|uniref:Uncharacterized protein n=1 Tax=Riccia fluitans TaxID=41844 RepID=A0ABD1YVX8_9MARC